MEYKDYYKVLGVDRNADDAEIKRVYRQLALKYHPDKNPGDKTSEERFKEINEAYEVLGDPEKRQKYNQLGASYRAWERTGGRPGGFDWSQWTQGAPGGTRVEFGDLGDLFGSGFSDFFNSIFSGVPGQQRGGYGRTQVRGRDFEQPVSISLTEAHHGTARILQYNGGRLEVKIPPGAKTGTKIRIAGKGQLGAGGPGDLFLKVKVENDPRFERKNDNLYTEVDVDLYTAILGGEEIVPTLDGPVILKIPQSSQQGQSFRLRKRGMPKISNQQSFGDLFVRIKIVLPENLSSEELELFKRLAALRSSYEDHSSTDKK
jgi:curved DNA-binding protein